MVLSKPTAYTFIWSILVAVTYVAQVIMNIVSGPEFGSFGGGSNSEISAENPTFVTPDGLTFSVWSIIYGFQCVFAVYQVVPCFQNSYVRLNNARPWIVLLFIGNCLWLPLFSNRRWFASWLMMIVMDVCLIQIYRQLRIQYGSADPQQGPAELLPVVTTVRTTRTTETAPWYAKILLFVGFSTNLAWLVVASVVNTLVAIGNSGWSQTFNVLQNTTNESGTFMVSKQVHVMGNVDFAICATMLVAALAVVVAIRNSDVPYACVSMWALWGVYRAQAVEAPTGFPEEAMSSAIADWALAMIVVIFVATLVGLAKAIVESVWAMKHEAQETAPSPVKVDTKEEDAVQEKSDKSQLYGSM